MAGQPEQLHPVAPLVAEHPGKIGIQRFRQLKPQNAQLRLAQRKTLLPEAMGQIVQRQPLMDGALKLVVLAVRLLNGGMNPFLRGRPGRRSVGDPAAFFQAVQPVEIGFFLAGPNFHLP